jgi:hypothetical protein
MHSRKRGFGCAQEKWRTEGNVVEYFSQDALIEGLEINHNVWKFRHETASTD